MKKWERVLQIIEIAVGGCGIAAGSLLHYTLRKDGVLVPGALLLAVTGALGVILAFRHSPRFIHETLMRILRRTLLFLNGSLSLLVLLEFARLI